MLQRMLMIPDSYGGGSAIPASVDYEFTCGVVRCLVVMTHESRPTARVYVVARDGHTLRPLADSAGHRVEFVGNAGGDDALHRALDYLETRFGVRGPAWLWGQPRPDGYAWTVHDSPLRPGDDWGVL
jgi:hypothetical protein